MRRLSMESLEGRHLMAAMAWHPVAPQDHASALVALAETQSRDPALWPFAATSPWNTGIGSGAQYATITGGVNTGSSASASLNSNSWSHPIYRASNSDPLVAVYWGNSKIGDFRVPTNAQPDPQADHHLHIVSPNGLTVLEMWNTRRTSSTRIDTGVAVVNDLTDAGVYSGYHGARAYGGSAIAGLIRSHELSSGEIPHALAIAVSTSSLNRLAPGGNPYVWPASSADGGTGNSYGTDGNLYMGSLVAIPRSVNIDGLPISDAAKAVGRALQNYGAYVTDTAGGNVVFYAEPGSSGLPSMSHLAALVRELRVVTNNGPNNVGGGGTRFVEPAPPFVGQAPAPTPTPTPTPTAAPAPDPTPAPAPAPVVQAWDIAGTLQDNRGRALSNVMVHLFIPGANAPLQTVRTNSAGRFTFLDVPAGTYAVASDGGFGSSRWTDKLVTVVNVDVLNVSLAVNAGGRRR